MLEPHISARALLAGVIVIAIGFSGCRSASETEERTVQVAFQEWSDDVFERARMQDRLVLLHVGAVWCHWCHVMEHVTYEDPAVVEAVRRSYLPVRVDQDARPDLSKRYQDYGWPATVILDGRGRELVKFRGYIPPWRMRRILDRFASDPRPVSAEEIIPATAPTSRLSPDLKRRLVKRHLGLYDEVHGGWGRIHKFLDADTIEYCLRLTRKGDRDAERMARETLQKERLLIDPVWGGAYQYSHGGVWENPHFEKIMSRQVADLRAYALAYATWGEAEHLKAGKNILRYLRGFLRSPEGAFYTSQDADLVKGEHSGSYFELGDAERRERGIPAIDTNIYARENGWAITALALWYGVTGDESALADANAAADYVLKHRRLEGGGFLHGEEKPALRLEGGGFLPGEEKPGLRHDVADSERHASGSVASREPTAYLGDSLAMGRALLVLYEVTGERRWLEASLKAAGFIDARFRRDAGFVTATRGAGPLAPVADWQENLELGRWTNRLYHYTGEKAFLGMAEHAMAWLAVPERATVRYLPAGILLFDVEFGGDPLHVTVVGNRKDATARELFATALTAPETYRRVEWWDPSGQRLPRHDIEYPKLERAAAFLCTAGSCSAPIEKPDQLRLALIEN